MTDNSEWIIESPRCKSPEVSLPFFQQLHSQGALNTVKGKSDTQMCWRMVNGWIEDSLFFKNKFLTKAFMYYIYMGAGAIHLWRCLDVYLVMVRVKDNDLFIVSWLLTLVEYDAPSLHILLSFLVWPLDVSVGQASFHIWTVQFNQVTFRTTFGTSTLLCIFCILNLWVNWLCPLVWKRQQSTKKHLIMKLTSYMG